MADAIKHGGPAFPAPPVIRQRTPEEREALLTAYPGAAGTEWEFKCLETAHAGMTLRDYFASAAVQGLLAAGLSKRSQNISPEEYLDDLGVSAYRVADAMLAERAKP